MFKWLNKLRRGLASFGQNRKGNFAIVFALMAVPLIVAIGGAADIGRWLHARDQTIAAIDAAVLAGASALRIDSDDTAGMVAAANKFYEENVRRRLKLKSDTIAFVVADDGTAVTASGQAYIETPFLRLASIDKLPLINVAGAEFSKGAVAAGDNAWKNLEVSIKIDLSQSLDDQKLGDLKDAAKDLIDM